MNIKLEKDINICGIEIKKGSTIVVHTNFLSVDTINKDSKTYCYPIIPKGVGKTLSELVKEINNQNKP